MSLAPARRLDRLRDPADGHASLRCRLRRTLLPDVRAFDIAGPVVHNGRGWVPTTDGDCAPFDRGTGQFVRLPFRCDDERPPIAGGLLATTAEARAAHRWVAGVL